MSQLKGKRIGAKFEGDIVKALRKEGYFIYRKGVSTKGIDILALYRNVTLQLELKSLNKLNKTNYNSSVKQYIDNKKYIIEYYDKFAKYHDINIQYYLLIHDRHNNKFIVVNDDNIVIEYNLVSKNVVNNFRVLYKELINEEYKFNIQ